MPFYESAELVKLLARMERETGCAVGLSAEIIAFAWSSKGKFSARMGADIGIAEEDVTERGG